MNVKFTLDDVLIASGSVKKPVKGLWEMSYLLSVTSLVIFLSFENFSLILEHATQFIFNAR